MASLTFLGASRQVTGSCYHVETKNTSVLLDCGMFQGNAQVERQNLENFHFDLSGLDAVVLSHAHLDHSGLLPRLAKAGFEGRVYLTHASYDLVEIMLKDAAHLAEKDIEWENRQRMRAGETLLEPLYTRDDVEQLLKLRAPVDYGVEQRLGDDLSFQFHNAGHILGAAIVQLNINEKTNHKRLVFSGDLGNTKSALLKDPAIIAGADVLLLESTYGDRNHRSSEATIEEFREAVVSAEENGGNMLIPAFAVGRTQEVLFWLGKFFREGLINHQQVFLDSPMAIAASGIYFRYPHLLNDDTAAEFKQTATDNWQQWLPTVKFTADVEHSMQINAITGGAIIIAGSGMCTGGRIRHHLKNNLWRNNAHLLIVGYQAQGTLGRSIVDGARRVNILGKEIAVGAKIHTLGGFSAHADQEQLLDWASRIDTPRPELYLVHGELDKMLELQRQFHQRFHWYANIPKARQKIEL